MTFKDSNHYPQFLEALGHKDWRLPTRAELTNLFNNRAEIGGFTTKPDSGYARWYWSCTVRRNDPSDAWVVDFKAGHGFWDRKDKLSVSSRVVRAEP